MGGEGEEEEEEEATKRKFRFLWRRRKRKSSDGGFSVVDLINQAEMTSTSPTTTKTIFRLLDANSELF